ncbi:MAG: hypothetical protein WC699_08150 [Bacteroidales bacterium]|jgi:hypothetical protein
MKSILTAIILILFLIQNGDCQTNPKDFPVLRGPYIGQTPPGNQSKVFAPGFVSTEFGELNSVFNRDGNEFYFSRRGVPGKQSKIMVTRLENYIWTEPESVGFSTSCSDIDLFVTPDGLSMVFCSNRIHQKGDGVKTDHDFWISKREGKKWAEPQLFAKEALSEFEDYFPIVTNSGNLYFNSQRGGRATNDIYCSRFIDGKYSGAEKLPEPVNTQYREFDAFVNPDEKMILFSTERPGGFGGSDIYVSFKRPDGSWSEPKNLGSDINSAQSEYGATLSPDGKYFFYTSGKNGNEDIFWVSAEFIEKLKPVEDVFKVMELVTGQKNASLWPNFSSTEIPVLVFDSINTWLFHSEIKPDGFTEVKNHPGVYFFSGQHPLVRGNTITRMGDTWVATSIFSTYARRTGERYTAKDLAGIIIHEQFHIYSRNKHPRWVPNDGLLLLYPAETEDALFLRRIEKEAFKRAATSEKPEDICGWVKEGLKYRGQRMSSLPPAFRPYEPDLQRTEGLSDYIEKVARGLDPLNASEITNGIAPAGVRDLGYVEGRWIAMILDKVNPGWKTILEACDTLYLENILKNVVSDLPSESKSFSSVEIDKIKSETNSDLLHWREKQKKEVEQFDQLPGFRVEINASSKPLNIRIFEPLEIEILDDGSVFHRLIFSAGNASGSLRIMNQPCITWFDNALRIEKLVLNGLKEAPEINENENKLIIRNTNITLELKYLKISQNGSVYSIEL